MEKYNRWAGPYGLHLPPRPGPLYLAHTQRTLWFRKLEGTLYVQYNRVEPLSPLLLQRLERSIGTPVTRIIVDICHNFGGETHEDRPRLGSCDR